VTERVQEPAAIARLIREARRRRVFRVAALYIVGAWLVLQIADVLLPGFGVPETAMPLLLYSFVTGFPVALVFGWLFDIDRGGIHRTLPATAAEQRQPLRLQRNDYLILAALAVVMSVIILTAISEVVRLPRIETPPTQVDSQPVAKLANSVVILPFANISPDEENEYFSEGISEEIRAHLAGYGELKIIGRTSSEAFKGQDVQVADLARLLGVRYVLDGSVRKAGTALRITASLLDESGVQIWTETFDRQLRDVFAIQSEIAGTVARTVYPKLVAKAGNDESPTLGAFDHFLRGRELVFRRDMAPAVEELSKAIELDPEYPEALAEYAIALCMGFPNAAAIERARQAVDKAIELRPDMARAKAAKGLLISQQPDGAELAEQYFREALAIDGGMTDASNWLANVLGQQGKADLAFEVQRRAYETDPLHPVIAVNYASYLGNRGEQDSELQVLQKLIDTRPASDRPYDAMVSIFERQGRFVDMIHVAQRASIDGVATNYWRIGRAYALLGDYQTAAYWLDRSRLEFPNWTGSQFMAAVNQYMQGNYVEAAAEFEDALLENGLVLEEQHVWVAQNLGWFQSLAGDYRQAITRLESISIAAETSAVSLHAQQALAWAYSQTGQEEKALPILQQLDVRFRQLDQQGELSTRETAMHNEAYLYALNARMLGEDERALDLLQTAIDAGWRNYYICHNNPAWDALRNHPRFRRMMNQVKEDVDAQRAALEEEETPEAFIRRVDQVLHRASAIDRS